MRQLRSFLKAIALDELFTANASDLFSADARMGLWAMGPKNLTQICDPKYWPKRVANRLDAKVLAYILYCSRLKMLGEKII